MLIKLLIGGLVGMIGGMGSLFLFISIVGPVSSWLMFLISSVCGGLLTFGFWTAVKVWKDKVGTII